MYSVGLQQKFRPTASEYLNIIEYKHCIFDLVMQRIIPNACKCNGKKI